MDPIYILHLPHLSSSITFRAYTHKVDGRTILDRCIDEVGAQMPVGGMLVLYHDEADAEALRARAERGLFVFESRASSPAECLSEVALTFPDRTVVAFGVGIVFAPCNLIALALDHHTSHRNHYTYVAGLPAEVTPEVFASDALASLCGHHFSPAVHAGKALRELAALRQKSHGAVVRAEPLQASDFYGNRTATLPESLPLQTLFDSIRAEAALRLPPTNLDRMTEFARRKSEPVRITPGTRSAEPVAKPRILYFTPSCGFSGAEQSLCQVVPHLAEDFNQFAVVGFEGILARKLESSGCRTWSANVDLRQPAAAIEQLVRDILNWADPDVVHSNGEPGSPMLGALHKAGIPLVQHVRVVEVDALVPAMRLAAVVIAISEHTRAQVERLGIDRDKLVTLYNSVDIDRFREDLFDRAELRRAYGIPQDSLCMLMIARADPWKRQDLFLRAGAIAMCRIPQAWMAIAGEGGDFDEQVRLRGLIAELNLSSRLTEVGFEREIGKILAACDLLVLPSDGEPLGRCVIEAMAMARPSIVTDNGGSRELVEHGKTGLVVPHGDAERLAEAMIALLADDRLRREFGRASRIAAIRRFDAGDNARSLGFVFRRQLRRGSG